MEDCNNKSFPLLEDIEMNVRRIETENGQPYEIQIDRHQLPQLYDELMEVDGTFTAGFDRFVEMIEMNHVVLFGVPLRLTWGEEDADRMDIIGQNGNTGEHYES
jgi:hypothetical protein